MLNACKNTSIVVYCTLIESMPMVGGKDETVSAYIDMVNDCIRSASPSWDEAVENLVREMFAVRGRGGTVYFVGNGGSAGIAAHMSADFQKAGGFKTMNFYDPALITCMANDYGYEQVFSKPLDLFAKEGDALVAISSSGNSINVVNAAEMAKAHRCRVITLTGFSPDNRLRGQGDVSVYIPSFSYGIVESLHNMLLQQVIDVIQERDRKE